MQAVHHRQGQVGGGVAAQKPGDAVSRRSVHDPAAGVADGGGSKEGDHQVRPGSEAVDGQGLPEILGVFGQVLHFRRDVPQAAHPGRGVDQQPAHHRGGPVRLSLEDAIDQDRYVPEVGEEIRHPVPGVSGDGPFIDPNGRRHDVPVGQDVEPVDVTVHGLQRVVGLEELEMVGFDGLSARRRERFGAAAGGAAGKDHGEQQEGGHGMAESADHRSPSFC